ncbi:MAG: PilN domain-containing protein [Betaproteobacteria bacterium]
MTLGLAAAVVVAVHTFFATRVETQVERNKYLETEIVLLDKQIDEIRKLKEQTQALLARKRVVESLQTNRTETVRLLDQLVRQLPDGVYLKSIKQTGLRVNVIGYATSNARVSTLMRNFEASPWLESPSLVEIKAATIDNAPLNEFNLNVNISRPKEESAPRPKSSAPASAPKS